MNQPTDRERNFVSFLEQLVQKKERGMVAALRRGLGKEPGEAPQMCPYLVPWTQGTRPWQERAYYLVASLFAWHQGSWPTGPGEHQETNLGASFDRLAPVDSVSRPGVERRFVALLNCHADDLGNHLRHAVGLLKSKEIPIDWAQLLHDIQWWHSDRRDVQLAWARAFWGQTATPAEQAHKTATVQ